MLRRAAWEEGEDPGGVRGAPRGCYFIYPAGPQEKAWVGGVCVYMCIPGVSVPLPWVLCWDILHTRRSDSDGPG